ncbi:MAG: glycosyltransferase family 39 protein, partial [Candidatus Aenigmarchaeota archaeon]|nr:glycosyltransferase family 39 protein [Candidatus Aenigmarchaeota archaeon]
MLKNKGTLLVAVLFLFSMGVRTYDIRSPYETWDEGASVAGALGYGYNLYKHDFSYDAWNFRQEVPPVYGYLYAIPVGFDVLVHHRDLFTAGYSQALLSIDAVKHSALVYMRLFSALLGSLTVVLTYLIGKRLFDRKTALVGALILSLTPAFLAHTRLAAKDSPTVFFYTLAIYVFLRALENRSNRGLLTTAVVTGLAVGTKISNATLIP